MIFKIVILLSRLGHLMRCTHDLTVLTKTKEMTRYYESYAFGGKIALNTRFYHSNESQCTCRRWIKYALKGSSTILLTRAPSGPALACPNYPRHGPFELLYPVNALYAKHKQPNFYKQKRRHPQDLIVLQKPQITK
jgi:hypothetical protein